jgi:hypothetical protein
MRFSPKARMNVVTKEDKEERLRAFIARHIEAQTALGTPVGETTYRLLALSAESPAASALNHLAPELSAAGIKVEALLIRRSSASMHEAADCRFVTDVRLLDAHEQLVLDATTVWIGDCMRRDPLRRDSYELYSDTCPATAGRAVRSFAQIWRAAGPSGSLASERKWTGPRQPSLFDPSLLAGAENAPLAAFLRH